MEALMTFRRPECTLEGEDMQEVTVHLPEVREPLPLIVHHLPISMTFAFISDENILVIDPTHYEEAIMKGRMTVTMNTSGDVCAIQKAGGVGIMQSVVMQCLRVAAVKVADITSKIVAAVELYNTERALRKIKIHSSSATLVVDPPYSLMMEDGRQSSAKIETVHQIEKSASQGHGMIENNVVTEEPLSRCRAGASDNEAKISFRGPSCWDPYSKGVDIDNLRASLAARGNMMPRKREKEQLYERRPPGGNPGEPVEKKIPLPSSVDVSGVGLNTKGIKTLKDAVKPKNKRRNKVSSTTA